MPNKQAIVDRAAGFLGVRRLGQALPAEHNARITQGYNEVHAQLKFDGLATWEKSSGAPDEVVEPLAALIALNCLDIYKVSEELFARIVSATGPEGETAKAKIRRYTVPSYSSPDEPTDF